jgi:hypothetical protein
MKLLTPALALAMLIPPPAQAAQEAGVPPPPGPDVQTLPPAPDALAQCVAMHTAPADRLTTARWMFAAMSKAPQLSDLGSVPDPIKAELDKGFGRLLVRMVTIDCVDLVRPLAAENSSTAFKSVGDALGGLAMQELLGDKDVQKSLTAYTDFLSNEDFKALRGGQ